MQNITKKITIKDMIYLGLMTLTIWSQSLLAASPVWQVSKANQHVYIGGTIHLLAAADHPLPKGYQEAYNKAQEIILETDIEATQSPAFQQKMSALFTLPNEQSLQSQIKPDTYSRLEQFMTSRGIPISAFATFTPAGLSLTLTVVEYQRLGMQPQYGVDITYAQKAKSDGKILTALETPDEQLQFIATLNQGNPDKIVNHTLRDINRMGPMVNDLKSAWKKGDLNTLEKLYLAEIKRDYPTIYQTLILTRNNNWLSKIDLLFNDKDTELVLVGLLHLAGDEGLIAQLKRKGYRIQQL